MKSQKTKSVVLTIVAVLALVIFVVGVSYAWFQTTLTGQSNTIQTGTLTITFNNDARINIADAMPISDDDGYALTGENNISTYTLTNTGSIPIQYRVVLVPMTASEIQTDLSLESEPSVLADSLVKYVLVNSGTVPSASNSIAPSGEAGTGAAMVNTATTDASVTGYIIEAGTLDAATGTNAGTNTSISRDLRLWVDGETATIENAAGKYYGAKIKVQVLQNGGGATWSDYTAG